MNVIDTADQSIRSNQHPDRSCIVAVPPRPRSRLYALCTIATAAAWAVPLLLIVGYFLATPVLNWDDLHYADLLPHFRSIGIWKEFSLVITNSDLGVVELRTYGLARTLQIFEFLAFGKNPPAVYSLIAILHGASSFIVYALMRDTTGDRLTALFAAF